MRSLRFFWITVLLSAACCTVDRATATVDPNNASTIFVPDKKQDSRGSELLHPYNVTHTYYRDSFKLLGVGYNETRRRCVQNETYQWIHYWINTLQLPKRLKYYNERNQTSYITERRDIIGMIDRVVRWFADELQLKMGRLSRAEYYETMDSLLVRPDKRYRGLLPVEVHFRSKPYPQSTFLEFVTDRDVVWELYHPAVYRWYAGRGVDLRYRFRHNFRHSLGLGHLNDTTSIMYPTNVLGQYLENPLDVDAVHVLLCSRQPIGRLAQPPSPPSTPSSIHTDYIVIEPQDSSNQLPENNEFFFDVSE